MEFLLFGLLGAAGFVGLVDLFDGGDEEETPVAPEDPEEEPDTGAAVIENEDGSFHIELGEDETGSLAAIKIVTDYNATGDPSRYELGFFLVPEGVEIPVTNGQALFDEYNYTGNIFEELGLTEIAYFDLGTFDWLGEIDGAEDTDQREEPPEITANAPFDIFRFNFAVNDDGSFTIETEPDETLSPFETPGAYYQGIEASLITGDYAGTGEIDFAYTPTGTTGPLTAEGAGGDDYLVSAAANSTLIGGEGDDMLYGLGDRSSIAGGDGNDTLQAVTNATLRGGEGDDRITLSSDSSEAFFFGEIPEGFDTSGLPADSGSLAYGGLGNDYLMLSGPATGYGGMGDDRLILQTPDAHGFGGNGADFFSVSAGASADGGAGNDSFQLSEFFDDLTDVSTVSGGEGSDAYDVHVRNVYGSHAGQSINVLHITDFEPDEDVISVTGGYNTSVADARVEEAADGSYTNLIVALESDGSNPSDPNAEIVIRLDGVSGYTADQLLA